MYRAFNVEGINWSGLSNTSAEALHNKNTRLIKESLDSFIKNGIINGTKLRTHWFPTIEADVFISHSHRDASAAIKCASWLKDHFGLNAFVDSSIWGHAEELLKTIDDVFCPSDSGTTYDYLKRNQSTCHVHMMLATALSEMIDSAECVFFLNTPNSITTTEAISKTKSSWLFYELASMRTMRRNTPTRIAILQENFAQRMGKAASMTVEYVVSMKELTTLSLDQINTWHHKCTTKSLKGSETLDFLYQDHPTSD